jgi:hypothetical protein
VGKTKQQFLADSSWEDTQVQFHQDQIHLLAINGTQLAIYETKKLECVKQVSSFIIVL